MSLHFFILSHVTAVNNAFTFIHASLSTGTNVNSTSQISVTASYPMYLQKWEDMMFSSYSTFSATKLINITKGRKSHTTTSAFCSKILLTSVDHAPWSYPCYTFYFFSSTIFPCFLITCTLYRDYIQIEKLRNRPASTNPVNVWF